jgi:hypothetical protein
LAGGFEDVIGGEALQGDSGGRVEVHSVRDGDEVPGSRHSVRGVAAHAEQGDHPVANVHVFHAVSHLGDGARHLRSRRKGQLLGLNVLVAASHRIRVVDPGRFDLDEHLALARGRALDLDVLQHLRLPELVDPYRLHLRHVWPTFLSFEPALPAVNNYTPASRRRSLSCAGSQFREGTRMLS